MKCLRCLFTVLLVLCARILIFKRSAASLHSMSAAHSSSARGRSAGAISGRVLLLVHSTTDSGQHDYYCPPKRKGKISERSSALKVTDKRSTWHSILDRFDMCCIDLGNEVQAKQSSAISNIYANATARYRRTENNQGFVRGVL